MRRNIFSVAVAMIAFEAAPASAQRQVFAADQLGAVTQGCSGGAQWLGDVFLADQEYPPVSEKLGNYSTHQRSSTRHAEDARSCNVAFLKGLVALEKRAQHAGTNAVVTSRAITGTPLFERHRVRVPCGCVRSRQAQRRRSKFLSEDRLALNKSSKTKRQRRRLTQ